MACNTELNVNFEIETSIFCKMCSNHNEKSLKKIILYGEKLKP